MDNCIISGIYKIENTVNGKCYIGSSTKLLARWNRHKNMLSKNKHENSRLQNSYGKHGAKAFTFTVLEYVEEKTDLIHREQVWMNALLPEYNICKVAGSCLGVKLGEKTRLKQSLAKIGKKASNETKIKMSIARLGVSKPPRTAQQRESAALKATGKPHSEETRALMSRVHKLRCSTPEARAERAERSPHIITRETRIKMIASRAANRIATKELVES